MRADLHTRKAGRGFDLTDFDLLSYCKSVRTGRGDQRTISGSSAHLHARGIETVISLVRMGACGLSIREATIRFNGTHKY